LHEAASSEEGVLRFTVAAALIYAASLAGETIHLDSPLPVPVPSFEWLRYDDETACWLTWEGQYRGVWFDLEDFFGPGIWGAGSNQFWFYQHESYPWDTSSFYAELYHGEASGPQTLLDQTSVTALHYSQSYVEYPYIIDCGNDFWVVVNTGMSDGGWPSLLGDGTPGYEFHSFSSDDAILWQSWGYGDYVVRAYGEMAGLATETWGGIKALYF
jgi:hypothetical protein